jgi:hypothetical protein
METLARLTGDPNHTWLSALPKGFFRAVEKAVGYKGSVRFFGETVCDLLRGALQYDRMSTQLLCLRLLCALDPLLVEQDPALKAFVPSLQGCAERLGVHILDLKNRYANPTSAGWADCCIRMYFLNDPQKHVFEIQLVHLDLFRCRARLGAHGAYGKSRGAAELLERMGEEVPVEAGAVASASSAASGAGSAAAAGAGGDLAAALEAVKVEMRAEMAAEKAAMEAKMRAELAAEKAAMQAQIDGLQARLSALPAAATAQLLKERMTQQMMQPAAPLEPSRCTASGPGLKGDLSAGKPVSFTITTYRTKKKPGSDVFDVVFRTHPDGDVVDAGCSVKDRKDGSHAVTYKWPHTGSVFTVSVECGGSGIKGSPFTLTCQ